MANIYSCKDCGFTTYHPEVVCGGCGVAYPDMDVRDDGPELEAIAAIVAAKKEGRLHATCSHDPPSGMNPMEIAAYEDGREEVLKNL